MTFEGWYFKHQKGDDTVAFIPGHSEEGAFLQMLYSGGAKLFPVERLLVRGNVIEADACRFSPAGCRIDLPGVSGSLAYGPFTPLRSDIMGPFRFFPMECRHGVLSMIHTLRGCLTIDDQTHCFDGGKGYAELDRGTSFPSAYQWLQCSDFPEPCSIMTALARIPFCGGVFRGCICAILYRGREYRLATYRGVRIRKAGPAQICLVQGKLRLEIGLKPSSTGHALRAPVHGRMNAIVRERCNTEVQIRLWDCGKLVIDLASRHGVCEYVPALET